MNDRYIVVYGLLKSMYDNEAAVFVRKHCRLVGEATFPGYLYDLENYPGVIYDEDSPFTVFGELFQITGDRVALTSFLDEFENVGPRFEHPNEYRKEVIPVTVGDKIYEASCYLYNWNPDGLKLIESGRYENIHGTRK